jgi:transposase
MVVNNMFFCQRDVSEFLVKEENSAGLIYERLRGVYGDACMGASSVRRWVKHFKDGNTDITNQPCYGRPRTAATERNKQKFDELIRQDRRITFRETAAQLGVGHRAVQEMMEILGCRKVYSSWLTRLPTGTEEHKTAENCSPIHPTVQIWLPSYYLLFGPLKDNLRGRHYETDEAVQEAVRSSLRVAGMDFYRREIFNILQQWQKCIDRDEDFLEK